MYNRKKLLKLSLNADKNVESLVTMTLEDDQKFIKRAKRNLEDEIEDLQSDLKKRLSANTPMDKSVVEVTYGQIKEKESLLSLYVDFEKDCLKDQE